MHAKLDKQRANAREQLVFKEPYRSESYGMGGVRYFSDMDVATAKKLSELGYIDPDDTQNLSPTAQEMIDFCDDGSGKWYLHGYVVSPERSDCRISFEGCGSREELSVLEAFNFLKMFKLADDLDCEPGCCAYCWFD